MNSSKYPKEVSLSISDLPYLEDVSENELIVGSVGALVNSYAAANGDNTYTFADANTKAREFRRFSIARGRGRAVAIGEDPVAAVEVDGDGDIVLRRTSSLSRRNTAIARGRVLAIDFHDR